MRGQFGGKLIARFLIEGETYRVVSTASMGNSYRSSSHPYALGVNLMTVCLV